MPIKKKTIIEKEIATTQAKEQKLSRTTQSFAFAYLLFADTYY